MAQLASGSPIPRILVALTVLRASAWACLLCFTDYSERVRICQAFVGMDDEEVKKCDTEFWEAFKNLSNVDFSEETLPPSPRALEVMWREGPEGLETQEEKPQTSRQRWGQSLRQEDRGQIETQGGEGRN